MFRTLLLKFARYILQKYDCVPLDMKDKVLLNGTIFEIQEYEIRRDFFTTEATIKMMDNVWKIDTWADFDVSSIINKNIVSEEEEV